jgi:hypothetical protein
LKLLEVFDCAMGEKQLVEAGNQFMNSLENLENSIRAYQEELWAGTAYLDTDAMVNLFSKLEGSAYRVSELRNGIFRYLP